jgi:hypothetical protein
MYGTAFIDPSRKDRSPVVIIADSKKKGSLYLVDLDSPSQKVALESIAGNSFVPDSPVAFCKKTAIKVCICTLFGVEFTLKSFDGDRGVVCKVVKASSATLGIMVATFGQMNGQWIDLTVEEATYLMELDYEGRKVELGRITNERGLFND